MTVTVITGPTASGKSALAVELAKKFDCEIISADSRQIYRGIPVTTAAPSAEQLAAAPHRLVGFLPLDAYYSAAMFADDARGIIEENRLRGKSDVIVCGGSVMYLNALLGQLDELPDISPEVRSRVLGMLDDIGLDGLYAYLGNLDPEYAAQVDKANPRRVCHAVELCIQSGRKASELLTRKSETERDWKGKLPFKLNVKIINPPRDVLFDRINRRVESMVHAGMEHEARSVFHLRHLNSLNTIGFKEWFDHFDGKLSRSETIGRIAKNTRVYAKKQITMLKKLFPDSSVLLTPIVALCLTFGVALTLSSCHSSAKTPRQTVGDTGSEAVEIVRAPAQPSLGGKRAMIHAVIYKTNGDYNDYVTALYDKKTGTFISYPAPSDIQPVESAPLPLADGWLLDRRGTIGDATVFLRWTMSQYSKLAKVPSIDELRQAIMTDAKVTRFEVLPMSSFDAQRDTARVNRLIHEQYSQP